MAPAPESPTSHSTPDSPPAPHPSAASGVTLATHTLPAPLLPPRVPYSGPRTHTPRDASRPVAATRRLSPPPAPLAKGLPAPGSATARAASPETASPRLSPSRSLAKTEAADTRHSRSAPERTPPSLADDSPRLRAETAPASPAPDAEAASASVPVLHIRSRPGLPPATSRSSFQHPVNLARELLCCPVVRGNYENGVIAGQGPHHLRPVFRIHRRRHRLRAAHAGFQHQQVLRQPHIHHKLPHQPRHRGQHRLGREVHARQLVPLRRLHYPQLPDVPRKGGLSCFMSLAGQYPLQFLLAFHRAGLEKLENRLLSCGFAHEYLFTRLNNYAGRSPFLSTP